jgi:hypothetical protein
MNEQSMREVEVSCLAIEINVAPLQQKIRRFLVAVFWTET